MKHIPLIGVIVAVATGVAGCTEGVVQGFEGGQAVVVEGFEHGVRPLPQGANSYQAFPNRPTMADVTGTINPEISRRNVLAIEAVTGCKVAMTSIQNNRHSTIAAVQC